MTDLIERPNAKHFKFTIGMDEDGILYVPFREIVDNIQSFQTVEAIPVEWVREWIFAHEHFSVAVGSMLYDWQKEQR